MTPILKPHPQNKGDNRVCAIQKLQIKKKEERLLKQRIKDIEIGLKSYKTSRKNVYKIYSKGV